jgi:3'(2'), 5'-bisphosphate nucleotidase
MQDLQEILPVARDIAWGAAKILRSYYRGTTDLSVDLHLDVQYKDNEPVTAADVTVSQYILSRLQSHLGKDDFGYVSEETYKSFQGKHPAEWVWIIDPLDGTRDFIDKTGDYAIHIALVQGTRPVLAVVAIPETEKLYYAIQGKGAFVETSSASTPLHVSVDKPLEDLTLVVSRSHRHAQLEYLLQNLPCQHQKAVGSVGCKIAAIVEKEADIYISLSGKSAPKDWDMAAPELILIEAGGKFTHFDGSPLQYNSGDVNQWGGLLASNAQHHEKLCNLAETALTQFSREKN